jgi:hypothetical protein
VLNSLFRKNPLQPLGSTVYMACDQRCAFKSHGINFASCPLGVGVEHRRYRRRELLNEPAQRLV